MLTRYPGILTLPGLLFLATADYLIAHAEQMVKPLPAPTAVR